MILLNCGSFSNCLPFVLSFSRLFSLPSTPTSHGRWSPLPQPVSARDFFLLNRSFSFPLSSSCCSYGVMWLLEFLSNIIGSLRYNKKQLETTVVVTRRCINKTELNLSSCSTEAVIVRKVQMAALPSTVLKHNNSIHNQSSTPNQN